MRNKKINDKFVKGLFAILIATVLLLSMVPLSAVATDTDITKTVNEKSTVKAKAASIKITWNGNGGKIGTKKTTVTSIKKGSKINKLPATPKRSGYALKGWYTKTSGGTKITKNTVPKKKVTYHAQWLKTYTLTFDPNGGKVTPSSKKVAKTKTYGTLPKPTRSGYTFKGWYTAKAGGTKVSTTTKMPAKNVKVYAQWIKGSSTSNRVLNSYEKELVGAWSYSGAYSETYRFNADGTYIQSSAGTLNGHVWHSYITANWAVTSNGKIKLTNVVGTWTNLGNPSNDYKNKAFSDSIDLYKIQINNGKLQIAIHHPSSYIEGSEQNKWTIDEYIAKGYPTWYTKE